MLNIAFDLADREVTKWLYGDWSKEKYQAFAALYSVPPVRNYLDYKLDQRSDAEYMRRYDIDWKDIHDPRKLRQTGSTSRLIGSSYHMISKNISRLYE